MRFFIFNLLIAFFVALVVAKAQQKSILVSYPPDTPQSVLDSAMKAIKEAGGVITHEYDLIKGFAAKASDKAIEAVNALENGYTAFVEEDSVVSINGKVNAS